MTNYSNEQIETLKNGIIGKTISLTKKIECGGFKFNTSICENCTIIDVYQHKSRWDNIIVIKSISKNGESKFFYLCENGSGYNVYEYNNDEDIMTNNEAFIQF